MTSREVPEFVSAEPRSVSRWGQERRLEFIDWRLRWDGRINRSHLTSFFGISIPQASLDIAKYLEMAPTNTVYDRSARVYLAAPEFKPQFASNTAERYLNELMMQAAQVLSQEHSFLGWRPPVDLAPTPGRAVPADILAILLIGIRERTQVAVSYQSMSSLKPTHRALSPHAIASDGFRWHVRAYCHNREQFLDFVIPRLLSVSPTEAPAMDSELDDAWHRRVTLELGPNPALSAAARKVIELDYGMTSGRSRLDCRQALLFYALKRLGLLDGQDAPPEVQQIVLLNKAEIAKWLPVKA
jgi:WYL domain